MVIDLQERHWNCELFWATLTLPLLTTVPANEISWPVASSGGRVKKWIPSHPNGSETIFNCCFALISFGIICCGDSSRLWPSTGNSLNKVERLIVSYLLRNSEHEKFKITVNLCIKSGHFGWERQKSIFQIIYSPVSMLCVS